MASAAAEFYWIVVNDEDQYSIWPGDQQIPAGWQSVGDRGSKEDCLAWIEENWTDMRPLSLRRSMDSDRPAGGVAGAA
ncbi:MbtH family NRPS accessory protein [Streptomyces sp. NPDC051211]|uniref:MbtH family protein n=1 Tax=Streptomyces sp. NPDC051211 TaxID=3154643 RepID=UPI00344F5682